MALPDAATLAEVARTPLFGIGLTIGAYAVGLRLNRWSGGLPATNPALIAVVLVGLAITLLGIPHAAYMAGAGAVHFLLGPAVVLLAVPLLRQARLIRASRGLVACALLVGIGSGLAASLGLAWLLGASWGTILALAPKSVTAGAAIGVAELLGTIPSLTAALVVMTGLTGAVAGATVARWVGARDERAVGLALGIASHGFGTARALRIGPVAGAFAGLGMGLGSVITALLLGGLSWMG